MLRSIVIFTVFFSLNTWAQTGIGIIVGNPTGISANHWLSGDKSIDAALAFDLDDSNIHLHSTYLWHQPDSIDLDGVLLGWYYGVGAKIQNKDKKGLSDDSESHLGARGSLGLHLPVKNEKFDFFAEAALVMNIIPETDLDLDLGIGARIYF